MLEVEYDYSGIKKSVNENKMSVRESLPETPTSLVAFFSLGCFPLPFGCDSCTLGKNTCIID